MDDDLTVGFRTNGGAGAELHHAADHGVFIAGRSDCGQFRPPTNHADRAELHVYDFRRVDGNGLSGIADAMDLAGLHLPDRLRHGATQPILAGDDGRYRHTG